MKFTEADFHHINMRGGEKKFWEYVAERANARLAEMLQECQVVYGNAGADSWTTWQDGSDIYTARLVDVKELK
jgi:hypothetical protein